MEIISSCLVWYEHTINSDSITSGPVFKIKNKSDDKFIQNVKISNMQIKNNSIKNVGVYLDQARNCVIEKVYMYRFSKGVKMQNTTTLWSSANVFSGIDMLQCDTCFEFGGTTGGQTQI